MWETTLPQSAVCIEASDFAVLAVAGGSHTGTANLLNGSEMIGTGDLGAAKDTLNINDAAANGTMTNRGTEALKVFSTSTDTAALVALAPACIGVAVWSVCRYLRCER